MTRANEELKLRNFYLERQVDQLRRLYTDATKDTTVEQRSQLQFLNQYRLIPAKVVSNSVNRPDNLITIDKGTADGVQADMGVPAAMELSELSISPPNITPSSSLPSTFPRRASVAPFAVATISATFTGPEVIRP